MIMFNYTTAMALHHLYIYKANLDYLIVYNVAKYMQYTHIKQNSIYHVANLVSVFTSSQNLNCIIVQLFI